MPKPRTLALHRSSRRWSDVDARAVLAALDASDLSVHAFAIREGIDPQRLYFWRRRLEEIKSPATPPAFVEVRRHASSQVEIRLRSARVLRVEESIDSGNLRRLVEVLEEDPAC